MSIRSKVALGIISLSVLFIAARSYLLYHDFDQHFREIEVSEVSDKLGVLKGLLDSEVDRITLHVLDNASWDDAYAFAAQPNQEFVDINFPDYGLSSIYVSFAAISDTKGKILMEKGWDLTDKSPQNVPSGIREMLTEDSGLMHFSHPTDKVSGIFVQDGNIYLVAARPILKSDDSGSVHGTLVMGRLLDGALKQTFSELLREKIEISALSIDNLKWFKANEISTESGMAYVVMGPDQATGASLADDLYGHPAVLLKVDNTRAVYTEGHNLIVNAILSLILLSLLLVAVIQLLLEKLVLSRLSRLSKQASRAEFSGDKMELIPGRDEISGLSRDFSLILEHLMVEKNRLNRVADSLGEGIFVSEKDGRIILVNKSMCRLIGLKTDREGRVKAGTKISFYDSRTRAVRLDVMSRVLDVGSSLDIPEGLFVQHKNGDEMPIHLHAVPIIQDGKPVAGVFVCRDTSREKALETTRASFLATASRYMTRPLEKITWYLEFLTRELTGSSIEQREAMQEIRKSAEGLLRTMDDLSIVTALEAGKNPIGKARHLGVSVLVKEIMHESEKGMADKRIRVNTSLKPGCCILGDKKEIRRVFEILMGNAVKYSKIGGVIDISCERKNGRLAVTFADSGIGIPKNEQEKIFKGFYRASNDKNENGIGLGLHLVKLIVEAHRGSISVESAMGKGSRFTLLFPPCGLSTHSQSDEDAA